MIPAVDRRTTTAERLKPLIVAAWEASERTIYGAPRVPAELRLGHGLGSVAGALLA